MKSLGTAVTVTEHYHGENGRICRVWEEPPLPRKTPIRLERSSHPADLGGEQVFGGATVPLLVGSFRVQAFKATSAQSLRKDPASNTALVIFLPGSP